MKLLTIIFFLFCYSCFQDEKVILSEDKAERIAINCIENDTTIVLAGNFSMSNGCISAKFDNSGKFLFISLAGCNLELDTCISNTLHVNRQALKHPAMFEYLVGNTPIKNEIQLEYLNYLSTFHFYIEVLADTNNYSLLSYSGSYLKPPEHKRFVANKGQLSYYLYTDSTDIFMDAEIKNASFFSNNNDTISLNKTILKNINICPVELLPRLSKKLASY